MVRVVQPLSVLAQEWQMRLQSYQDAIEREPASPAAWHWRVQIKVLRYLLSRYGNEPEPSNSTSNLIPLAHTQHLLFKFDVAGAGKAPRSPQTIRRTLDQIAAVNRNVKW